MNEATSHAAGRAQEMRDAFDRAFAEPVRFDATITEDLLAIRVGAEPCAIRMKQITGLFADKKITKVPGCDAALIGIAGFRGAVVPVYSLRALLGRTVFQPGGGAPRWLVVVAGTPVALAFEAFDCQLRVAPESILQQQSRPEARHVREFVQTQNFVGPIIHLPSVLATINPQRTEAASKDAPREER
jgi:chemotaxis signal transduction protein